MAASRGRVECVRVLLEKGADIDIYDKVNEDGTLQIEVSPGSYLKIEKSAISQEWSANVNKA